MSTETNPSQPARRDEGNTVSTIPTRGEDWVSRCLKAKYGRKTPLPVGFWINTMERLKKAEKKQADIEANLGEDRINNALLSLHRLRPNKPEYRRGLGDEQFAEIARKHPEVDPEVARWLSEREKLREEADNICLQLGHVVYEAYAHADLDFFEKLSRTLRSWTPTRATKLKDCLLWLENALGNPLPLMLSDLTDDGQRDPIRRGILNQITGRDLNRAYVLRLCSDLGIGLKAGKPGHPAGKRKL